jgi:acetyl-CoA synthetase
MAKAPATCREPMDAECSTSSIRPARQWKPKGIVHTTGGYLVGTYATTIVFDLATTTCSGAGGSRLGHRPQLRRHGPLANGATVVM